MRHEVVAITKRTGQLVWRQPIPYTPRCFPSDSITSGFSAAVAGTSVVVVDDGLHAFDAGTGEHRWTFYPPEGCMASTSWPGADGQTTVYAGASRGSVYALDAVTGAVRWRGRFLPESAAVAYSPVYHNGVVYAEFNIQVATFPFDSGGVVALDAATGAVRWIYYFPRGLLYHTPSGFERVAVAGSLVVAPSSDGIVYALDRTSGALVWQTPREDLERVVAAHGSAVFVGSVSSTTLNGMPVIALDTNGQELWRFTQPFSVFDIVADSRGVFLRPSASLIALDPVTGRELWRVSRAQDGSRSILGGPATDGSLVFAAANDGFYAFRR